MTIELYQGDCLTIMPTLPQVDAIITDLPYGTTACSWDTVIPFEPMWKEVKRICKGAFVTTASQPFTTDIINSNRGLFKYEWIWNKSHSSGFQYSKFRPMQRHENVLVFGIGEICYNQQIIKGATKASRSGAPISSRDPDTVVGGGVKSILSNVYNNNYLPTTDLYFNCGARCESEHPTQKPVALMEYLIRTYTNEGDTVLDICAGSGTTGVACVNTNRNFIGIELREDYYSIMEKRITEAQQQMRLPI